MSRQLPRWIAGCLESGRLQLRRDSPAALWLRRTIRFLEELPVPVEITLLVLVFTVAVVVRVQAITLVPGYIWSKDSMGYAMPAFQWLDSGEWVFDGRRGPIYSIFLGYGVRFFGGMYGVMVAQHVLALVGILASATAARVWFGRTASWILAPCGAAFAIYGPPIHYAHLIRNETLLFFFASIALAAWAIAIRQRSAVWLGITGLAAGILTLIKGVFLPFPAFAILGAVGLHWPRWQITTRHAAIFLAAFLLPAALDLLHERNSKVESPSRPQSGILFYGRTAQWTVLDAGIQPELKAQIRKMVEDYRRLPKLDNNVILKDTVVPRLEAIVASQGGTPSDLNRLCRQLAIEAIQAHPHEFAAQVWKDTKEVLLDIAERRNFLEPGELLSGAKLLRAMPQPQPVLDAERIASILEPRATKDHLSPLGRVGPWAWLFPSPPILLSLIGVLLLLLIAPGEDRIFWLGLAGLLGFTIVLLSTVGRPINRYAVPIMPVLFWVNTGVLVHALRWVRGDQAATVGEWVWRHAKATWQSGLQHFRRA